MSRTAHGPALESLCGELVTRTVNNGDVHAYTPLHDSYGSARVQLFNDSEMTPNNARLLARMSKRKFFDDLGRRAPSLYGRVEGLKFLDVDMVDDNCGGYAINLLQDHEGAPTGHEDVFFDEQLAIWEILQATADNLRRQKGAPPRLLERDLAITPDLKIGYIEPWAPASTIEAVKAVIVGHMGQTPISVDFQPAIPKPFAAG